MAFIDTVVEKTGLYRYFSNRSYTDLFSAAGKITAAGLLSVGLGAGSAHAQTALEKTTGNEIQQTEPSDYRRYDNGSKDYTFAVKRLEDLTELIQGPPNRWVQSNSIILDFYDTDPTDSRPFDMVVHYISRYETDKLYERKPHTVELIYSDKLIKIQINSNLQAEKPPLEITGDSYFRWMQQLNVFFRDSTDEGSFILKPNLRNQFFDRKKEVLEQAWRLHSETDPGFQYPLGILGTKMTGYNIVNKPKSNKDTCQYDIVVEVKKTINPRNSTSGVRNSLVSVNFHRDLIGSEHLAIPEGTYVQVRRTQGKKSEIRRTKIGEIVDGCHYS